ncbi:type II toxin-antitoxin system VapC family toxin [Candidatus Electrothrix sp.]|uniref:type II toxin-antitoxin system VapC family toxin n=1 Tax=Candidatus Electrothrix sp. TaxID=2170559 RepID=UPI004056659C
MKKLLLDTHTFLWWVENSPQLSDNALNIIQDIENECFLSLVSSWEMSIKAGIGKLKLTCSVQEYVPQHLAANQFRQLDISFRHVTGVESLELHHRDPFDRLLAAQALEDNLILVSADRIFDRYGVERVW